MQNKEILPALKLLYNRDTEFFLESISNFKRKVQIYFKPNITYLIPLVLTVIKFISPSVLLALIQAILDLQYSFPMAQFWRLVKSVLKIMAGTVSLKFCQNSTKLMQYQSNRWNKKLILWETKHQSCKMKLKMIF